MKKWLIFGTLGLGTLSLILFFVLKPKNSKSTTIVRGDVVEKIILSGEIKALEHAHLTFPASGEITWLGIKEGDLVKKGQLLATLDTSSLKTAEIAAYNTWLSADATAKRAEDSVKDHDKDESYTQKETRVNAQAARDAAYFNWQQASRNLKNAYLKAPFAGIVTQVNKPYTGINTTYTESQIEVLNPQTIYFSVAADQTETKNLRVNQEVEIILDTYSDEIVKGKITSIALTPETGAASIVYEVKMSFDQIDFDKYRIGMTGDVTLVVAESKDTLSIPPQFIQKENGDRFVWTDPHKKNKTKVSVGVEGGDKSEIIGDVKEGQTVYD